MSRREYIPSIHDPVLTELNQDLRRTDQEIADEMGFDKVTIGKYRNRLGLPLNSRPKPTNYLPKENLSAAKPKPNPLQVAKQWLGKRLVERPSGYWLDSVPVNLTCIMRATNTVIKAHGAEQLDAHPDWLV